jgi:hypothetical protein
MLTCLAGLPQIPKMRHSHLKCGAKLHTGKNNCERYSELYFDFYYKFADTNQRRYIIVMTKLYKVVMPTCPLMSYNK